MATITMIHIKLDVQLIIEEGNNFEAFYYKFTIAVSRKFIKLFSAMTIKNGNFACYWAVILPSCSVTISSKRVLLMHCRVFIIRLIPVLLIIFCFLQKNIMYNCFSVHNSLIFRHIINFYSSN